jgi:hypothetical protein
MRTFADYIQPFTHNPFYWQHNGLPIVLLGGSVEDNLFQITDAEAHLDLLHSLGGNYVRCTMSSRDDGNLAAFKYDLANGLFDLSKLNDAYWTKFEHFVAHAQQLGVIVQIELWDRWDTTGLAWEQNSFNPALNCNYTSETSGLPVTVGVAPFREANPFFYTFPELDDNKTVLPYQHAFVDKLLSITLTYSNILYCIDNETQAKPQWAKYWAKRLHSTAQTQGVPIQVTEMWEPHDLSHPWHRHTLDARECFTFFDASQNTHIVGEAHAQTLGKLRQEVGTQGEPMPINVVKIYGANTFEYGRTRDAIESFWRHIFSGLAATRFHRPPAGLGLNEISQRHIWAAREFVLRFNVFQSAPRTEWLRNRSANEAFCLANEGVEYALFFLDSGDVLLPSNSSYELELIITWLDIDARAWSQPRSISA